MLKQSRSKTGALAARIEDVLVTEISNSANHSVDVTVNALKERLLELFYDEMRYGYGKPERVRPS